jgi:hypothetical protein
VRGKILKHVRTIFLKIIQGSYAEIGATGATFFTWSERVLIFFTYLLLLSRKKKKCG